MLTTPHAGLKLVPSSRDSNWSKNWDAEAAHAVYVAHELRHHSRMVAVKTREKNDQIIRIATAPSSTQLSIEGVHQRHL